MAIKQGDIIYAQVDEISTDHPKFFIIAAITPNKKEVAAVFINKDININVFPTTELQALHHPIVRTNYSFLTLDSWVDCSDFTEFDFEEADEYVSLNPQNTRGKLKKTDLEQVLALLGNPNNNISPKRKLKFGF